VSPEQVSLVTALEGIHEELRDVRDDVAQVRSEVMDLRRNQELEKEERKKAVDDHRALHMEHRSLQTEVAGVHNDVTLLKENMRLTQVLNEKTHDQIGHKVDLLTSKFDKHSEQEELDRRELIKTLSSEKFQIQARGKADFLWVVGIAITVTLTLFGLLWKTGVLSQ
jgi:predicted nuclease with TOPRIM domain